MKEKSDVNEQFVALHESILAEGFNPQTREGRDEFVKRCCEQFKLGGTNPRHTYRAWVARLADPSKYGGRFSARMKPFQQQRNGSKTTAFQMEA